MGSMRGEPSCPKCGGRVRAPGLFADAWQCSVHGQVHPMQPVVPPSVEALGVPVPPDPPERRTPATRLALRL